MSTRIPLFPYLAHTAALEVARHLVDVGVHLATRASDPARYLVYVDRTQAHGEYLDAYATKPSLHHNGEAQHDDPKRFRVWGRSFLTGWCSAAELDAWRAGRGQVAIGCLAVRHDPWLQNAKNGRLVVPALLVSTPTPAQEQARRELAALTCGCGRKYTWAEYLNLEKPVRCRTEGVSDEIEGADDNGHPVIAFLRDCHCGNTMGRPKPEGA